MLAESVKTNNNKVDNSYTTAHTYCPELKMYGIVYGMYGIISSQVFDMCYYGKGCANGVKFGTEIISQVYSI